MHVAFCDSIDTRTVLETIRELISQSNVYIEVCLIEIKISMEN